MKLTGDEIRAAYFAVATCRRSLAGRTVPPSVAALAERLEVVLRHGEVTCMRQPDRTDAAELESVKQMELIGTRIAAQMLGWSLSTVLRHAADLDGRIVGHRWIFPARAVEEYRERLRENR